VSEAERPANVFAGLALDRNAELRDDPEWSAVCLADPAMRFIVLVTADGGHRAVLDASGTALRRFGVVDLARLAQPEARAYLGHDADGPLFVLALPAPPDDSAPATARCIDLRSAGMVLPAQEAGLFAYARALVHWCLRTRWCGACGSSLTMLALGHRARCTNPACAIEHFPRTDPAVIVVVEDGERCLLGTQHGWAGNLWSALAGFVEPGESLEDAVRREVMEEAGVRAGGCRYHSSQPWPFPASLMLGFHAVALDAGITVGPELRDARWFDADGIIDGIRSGTLRLPLRLSISHELIADWLRRVAGVELGELQARAAR